MKAAFHFNANFPPFGNYYGPKIEQVAFSKLLAMRTLSISSKIYIGDLPLFVKCGTDELLEKMVAAWCRECENVWRRFTDRMELIGQTESYVLCFESIGRRLASELHDALSGEECYLGAIEVDDSSEIHWNLYSNALRLSYRIKDDTIAVFFDELVGDPPNDAEVDEQTKRFFGMGFRNVRFESCAGRHSLFDRFHNFRQARRIAEWRRRCSDLLGCMVDEVVCRLGDAAPEIGNRLYAGLRAFEMAETEEEYAQVSVTCRRTLEYVADILFPARPGTHGEHKLGEMNYRNRLLAWMEGQTKSETTVEVIASSLNLFAAHVEKLQNLASKGVHANVQREGARRCLLRTVFLLDDVISLQPQSFPMNVDLDFSILDEGEDSRASSD